MKIRILIGALVILIVLNLATLGSYVYFRWVTPQHCEMPPLPHDRKFFRMPMQFNEQQRQQLFELRDKFREKVEPYHHQIFELQKQISRQITIEEADTTVIYGNIKEISDLRTQIEKEAVQMLLHSREFLSPEQVSFLCRAIHEFSERRLKPPMMRREKFKKFMTPMRNFNKSNN